MPPNPPPPPAPEQELARLRTLVQKLPATKDGVRVGWCDFVYNKRGTRYVVVGFHMAERDLDFNEPDRRVAVGEDKYLHVSELYSSREALAPAPDAGSRE